MQIRRRPPNPKVKVAHLEYAIPHEEGEPRNILEKIVWEKDREVAIARERMPLEQLKAKGLEFNDVELDLFRDKVRSVYEKNADRVGGMEAIEAVAKQ